MRLAKFILANIEPILVEWEAFALTLASGATMTKLALRDHSQAISFFAGPFTPVSPRWESKTGVGMGNSMHNARFVFWDIQLLVWFILPPKRSNRTLDTDTPMKIMRCVGCEIEHVQVT